MEKLLGDHTEFKRVNFNRKQKVNQELRHMLDMVNTIKACLDNLSVNNCLSKVDN